MVGTTIEACLSNFLALGSLKSPRCSIVRPLRSSVFLGPACFLGNLQYATLVTDSAWSLDCVKNGTWKNPFHAVEKQNPPPPPFDKHQWTKKIYRGQYGNGFFIGASYIIARERERER